MTGIFTERWENLLKSNSQVPSIRIFEEEPRDLFLGLRSKSPEIRVFFMLVNDDVVSELPELPRVMGFEISVSKDNYIYPEGKTRLEIALTDKENADIFDVLVEDIADRANATPSEPDAVIIFIDRIYQWQKFVEQTRLPILSQERQRGLFGELKCLRDLIDPEIGISDGLKSWIGPSGEIRDFEHNGAGIEVKTTITRRPRTFSVASELQLDDTHLRGIVVFHLALQRTQTSGESLVEMVDSVRTLVTEMSLRILFDQRLVEYGYSEDYRKEYECYKYSIIEQAIYLVGEEFPRIIESDLRIGVSNARYNVAIDRCETFEIDENTFHGFLKSIS